MPGHSISDGLVDTASIPADTALRMESHKLSPAAENIRHEITQMISETAAIQYTGTRAIFLGEDEQGVKAYGGRILARKISLLTEEMNIDSSWKWRVAYWSNRTKLLNILKQGYLIPLSKDIQLDPGGILQAGYYIQVINEPWLSSGAAAILIVPPS
ncbi:hypothetical protein PENVUL_c059G02916 [Penicillium vulpinum]|uniref:Uncharacterized protein n=1 Tax=Penicillium vulpinum TaxID=29845 RepID=A0A1V6RET1_9EURO|nr:hypothetical protein PENVUL_c059G02916 [Penicillium vulpinum]